jgi:outer membrane protein assembly factor BamE (lipoprotein component of BamABCDE complex)
MGRNAAYFTLERISLQMLKRGCRFLILGFVGGCAFSDGPYELVSGNSMSADQLNQMEAQHASPDRVRREIGKPDEIVRDGRSEKWFFTNQYRAISRDRVFLNEKISCRVAKNTYTVTFEDGRVTKVDTKSTTWVAQDHDCAS